MNVITALILGILIGWVIEWVIDWIYWRRRQRVLAEKLADVEADASNLRADNTSLNNSVVALEANAAQFGRVKGELDRKITSLETEVSGLEAERNGLQAKIVDLESQTSGEGSAGIPGVAAVAAAAGATRLFDTGVETDEGPDAGAAAVGATQLFDTGVETGEEPGAGMAGVEAVEEPGTGAATVAALEEPGTRAAAVEPVGEPEAVESEITAVLPVSETEFTGNVDPNNFAEIAKFKNPLEYVEGIGPVFAEKLKAIGLVNCLDFLKAGATRKGREEIVEKSGISSRLILKWVNHIDLYRIKGVGSEYADLLEAAGVDTVIELAQRNPANLFGKMNEVNAARELVRKPPTAAQVEDWTAQAKGLPRVVSY